MLFVESRTAERQLARRLRTPLLEALQAGGLIPLIRSARLHLYEQAAGNTERARELERALEERAESDGGEPYTHGDLFCFDDRAHYVVFGDGYGEGSGLRAGIVYDAATDAPAEKLEAFCQSVSEAFEVVTRGEGAAGSVEEGADSDAQGRLEWSPREGQTPEAFKRFASAPADAPPQWGAGSGEKTRAVEMLDDAGARGFLQRLSEAHADGRAAGLIAEGRG